MTRKFPRLVVAALRGGCGKTTVSLSLISAWKKQGRRIIPFKKGPDYIDAGWLAQASGEPCYNLDPYLMDQESILKSFSYRTTNGISGTVIEGNRGLYDGTDSEGTYSTAELAKLLNAPVVLVVDCTKATRTLAAVVYGCRHFDREINLAGVILNQVATSRQEKLVRTAIESSCETPVLGAIPRILEHDMPERHLGLVPHQEHPTAKKVLNALTELAESHMDLDRLWNIAKSAPMINSVSSSLWNDLIDYSDKKVKIGVIRDSAFQFYYPENLELLEKLGAKTIAFSSIEVDHLPDVDALYLGGGFPETHAELLATNKGLRDSIKKAADRGLPIYAECGGLMYLGEKLVLNQKTYPMAGVFPVTFGLEKKPQGHGYTTVVADRDNPYFTVGTKNTGHEFHYSKPLEYDENKVTLIFKVARGHGFDNGRDGLCYNNVLAGYTHLHALNNTVWAESLIRLAAQYKLSDSRSSLEALK